MKRQYLDGQAYAATAIAQQFCNKPSAGDRPRRFVTIGRSQGRLDRHKQMVESVRTEIGFMYQARTRRARRTRFASKTVGYFFLHRWTQVIAKVYHQKIRGDRFDWLAANNGEIAL